MADLSDQDVGLLSDDEVGVSGTQQPPASMMSDADVGLMSDDQVGLGNEQPSGRPAPEGPFVSGLREAAHAVIPTAAGLVGAGAGGAVGSAAGPIGTFAGGVGGMVAASMGADRLQHAALDAIGFNDDEQRAANAEANPKSSFVGGLAPAVATMSPVKGVQALQRATSGGLFGAFEAGQEYLHEGHVDPAKVAIATVAGVALPGANRGGEKLMGTGRRMVPGRPNREANPAADQTHADVNDPSVETAVGDSVLAEAPPGATGVTTGNPQSAPQRSPRAYPKQTPLGMPEQNYAPTQGHMDPATSAALTEANPGPEAAPAPQPVQPPAAPIASKPPLSLKPREAPEPVVDAGFPKPGEPVAVGENEATPLPAEMPARTQAAIAKAKEIAQDRSRDAGADDSEKRVREGLGLPPKVPTAERDRMPEHKGETPLNDTITPAQKAAGNFPKAAGNDFGKPYRVETHAGDMRRSQPDAPEQWEVKLPYDYGYFGKTMGPDGDPIDFARAVKGSPEHGDKHFIIDQKDATTGKYDEPKVFKYYKDQAAAVDAYYKGFSDGKGPNRLHDVTEVSRKDLVKFLLKHTTKPPTGPYGEPMPKGKPIQERAVVKDLVEKLKAAGKTDEVAKIEALPDDQLAKAIEGKRVRKYGVGTGNSAGYPVEGLTNDAGGPVTANTKAKAAERTAAHKAMAEWFEKSAPPKGEESDGALLDRIKGHPYPTSKGAWKPSFKPKEWMLAQAAKNTLAKPTPGNIKAFRKAESELRSGNDQDVANYRSGNRIEADIAQSKRSGDDAIAGAEAKLATEGGLNTEEDKMIAALDAKKANAKFDVPHEEAESMVKPVPVKTRADLKELPKRTVDVTKSPLAEEPKPTAAAAKRKAEAAALAGNKSNAAASTESAGAASAPRKIKITDPDEVKRLVEMANAAARKGASRDPKLDITAPEDRPSKSGLVDLVDRFANDERGSIDLAKIKKDLHDALRPTEPSSYIAKTAREPSADYTRSLSDDLHRISQEDKSHRIGLLQELAKLPKELNNEKTLEKMYLLHESGKISALTPEERALYDKHLKPILDQNDQFVKNIRAIDPDRIGPDVLNHISRITKGETPEYNMLKDRDDPTGPAYNGLSVSADAAKVRKFVALERVSDGQRFVISPSDKGFSLWQKYKESRITDPKFKFEAGQPYKAGKVDYVMRDALTPEIEANARGEGGKPMRYYKNAMLSAVMANAQLGSMARHLAELERIKNTPEFKKLTTTNEATALKRGWEESKLPNMKGTFMDPHLRYIFDDYAKAGFNTPDWFRSLNQSVTKLLFWMPTAHIANVGAHWFVGRGWDWITPTGMRSLAVDGAKAIKSVIQQDKLQQDLRNAGAGTISGGVVTRKFIEKVAKAVGEDIERKPSQWGPIADKLGVPLEKLGSMIYDGSSKVMWAANDMFLTQRILELERKGISRQQAIIQAERDIPNYRLPTTVLSESKYGRFLQQMMADPSITSFGRYHYGVFNSYANIVKDAVGADKTAGDRFDAVGKMMAMGLLAYAVYPALDKMAQIATGNKDASEQRRGPISIPHHIVRALQGKEDIMAAARSTMTMTPLTSTALETISNKDFRGKPIVQPGDVAAAAGGDLKAAGAVALQEGEHALRGLVSPYSTFANADKKGLNVAGAVRDQALDIRNPSPKATLYEQKAPVTAYREARTRIRQGGAGPLEGLYNKMLGR